MKSGTIDIRTLPRRALKRAIGTLAGASQGLLAWRKMARWCRASFGGGLPSFLATRFASRMAIMSLAYDAAKWVRAGVG